MYKKLIVFSMALILMAGLFTNFYAEENKNLTIQFGDKALEADAVNLDGQLYIPLRFVSEAAGYTVSWQKDGKVTAKAPDRDIMIKVGEASVTVNDHTFYIGGNAQYIKDRTYVPIEFASDCLELNVKMDNSRGTLTMEKAQLNAITIKTIKVSAESKNLTLNLQYPEISGMASETTQSKMNAVFKKLAADAKADAEKSASEMANDPYISHMKTEEYVNYNVKYNQNGLLSIVFQNYIFTGGAHGSTIQSGYTYNLGTGQEYKIKDLFVDNADYATVINKEILKQMAERQLIDAQLVDFKSINEDQNYYLTHGGIVVYFQQYEYFPYAAGIQEFETPYAALEQMLKAEICKGKI